MSSYTYAQPLDEDSIFIKKSCPICNITNNGGCVTGLCNQSFSFYKNTYYDIPLNCKVANNYLCFCDWDKLRNINGDYHGGTPTLFHPEFGNSHSLPGVPQNAFGLQADNTFLNNSSGYIGITTYSPNNRRDYIMLENGYMMTAGNTYMISFYASLAEISEFATSIQMYIGPSLPNFPSGSATNINMTLPAQHYRTSPVISNFNDWTYITFTYTATTTGLHQIYLGNFRNNLLTPVSPSNTPVLPGVGKIPNFSYIYIDDFNIAPIAVNQELCCNFDHIVGYRFIATSDTAFSFPDTLNNQSYSVMPGDKVFIHGVVCLNQSITYSNVDFLFDANAVLFINNGANITFNNCSFRGCYALWEGIQAFSGNVSLIFNNCTIEDMNSGIMLTGGSPLTLNNCRFNNNRRSLELKDFNSIWPLIMRANVFQQQGTFKPFVWYVAPVYSTTNYVQPEVHVELKNVFWANITAPTGTGNRNHFKHAIVGIHAVNSGLTVSNAFFNQIKYLPPSGQLFGGSIVSTTGWAIKAKAPATGLRGIKVFNQWGVVRIQQCDNGIEINGGYYSEIKNNWLFNIKGTGIKQQNTMPWPTWNNTTSQIQINNNQIQMVTVGIDLYNNGNTFTEVKENTIQNTAYRDRSVAIRAQNLLLKPSKCKFLPNGYLNIKNNYTFCFETGIQADLCNCLKISGNEVRLNNPGWDQAHGIWVRSSLGALIDDNNIYGSGTHWYSQGIRLEFSPQTTISCNYVTNTENALWIHNNNIFSTVIGNTFQQYKNGLHLTYNGIIGSQFLSGSDYYDLYNSFNTSNQNDLFTSLNTIGDNSPYCAFSSLTSENDFTSTEIPILMANNNSFTSYCRINNIFSNIPSFIFAGPYKNENRWINKWKHKQFFKSMEDSLFQLFPNINYIYQLEDSIELTEINKFILADSLMANKQWNDADLLLQEINSTEIIEEYWKNTNQIMLKYLPVFLLGNDTTVSLTDHNSLLNIANSCPYQLGDIVNKVRIYVLRHINPLEVFSDNCITGTSSIPRLSNGAESLVKSIIYPNPGEDELYVKLNGDENVDLILYDLHGRLVFIEQNYQSETLIFTKDFKPGYYYIVLRNNEVHEVFPWIKK